MPVMVVGDDGEGKEKLISSLSDSIQAFGGINAKTSRDRDCGMV